MALADAITVDLEMPPDDASLEGVGVEDRQVSMMEGVRELIDKARSVAAGDGERLSPRADRENIWSAWSPLASSTPCPSEQAAAAALIAPVFSDGLHECEGVQPFCQSSFRRWVLGSIVFCVLLASTSMFVALDRSTNLIRSEAIEHCERAMGKQNETVDQLVDKNVTAASFKATLRSMSVLVEELVKAPAARAVAALSGSMKGARRLNASSDAREPRQRDRLAYRAWVEMSRQWGFAERNVWTAENPRRHNEEVLRKAADALSVHYLSGEAAGCEVRRREFDCPRSGPELCGGCNGWCTRMSVSAMDSPGSINGSTVLTHEVIKHGLWEQRHMTSKEEVRVPTGLPSLRVQARYAEQAATQPGGAQAVLAEPLWSEVYFAERSLKLSFSWTAPIAHCGNYSCFEGAVAAEVSLPRVSVNCARAWANLSQVLASPEYDFPIGSANSSLFVVHVDGASEHQRGQLIGTSDAYPVTTRVHAEDASQEVVRATARAVLAKFGAWNATDLLYQEQLFTFRRSSALLGHFTECTPELQAQDDARILDCWQVGTLVVELDKRTRWLLVATLPAGAFNRKAVSTAAVVKSQVESLSNSSYNYVNQARMTGVGVIFFIAAISISLGFALGCAVSEPLQRLGHLMHLLSDLDWGCHSAEIVSLCLENQRAHIRDISELQSAFCSLVRGIEAFTKFVPGTVVTRVIRGDRRATRLHVDRRDVTVMFSSIGNFKQVSKELTDEALLKVIGRYHTIMTLVVEYYEGAVAEILDDGLLVYFNTPDKVTHHAAKACDAALAQQRAMEMLNVQLAESGWPTLEAHIGIHTGNVLSGNIGTDRKMKFGCMGDSVNLASRLNGCCKFYGVPTILSGATYAALPKGIGLFCRKLDLVRVKGRREPTPIYDIVGREQRVENYIAPAASIRSAGSGGSSTFRKSFTETMARAYSSRSPAAATTAAGFHVPGMHCRSPSPHARKVRSPSKQMNPFHFSPTADLAPVNTEGGPSPFFMRPVVEGGQVQPAQGDISRTPSGSVPLGGDDDVDADGAQGAAPSRSLSGRVIQVPVRLPCLRSRVGSLNMQKQGRRRSLNLPGDSADALPTPSMLGRAGSVGEPGATTVSGAAGLSAASTPGATNGPTPGGFGGSPIPDDCVTPALRSYAMRYEEALHAFQQASFTEARDVAGALLEEHPGDVPTQMLFKRATIALDGADNGGLSEDQLRAWTGERRMDEK